MKKIFSFMSLSLVMLLASCSQDNVVEEATAPEEGRVVTISAGIEENKDSRLIYDDPTGDITWNKEDKLYVLGIGVTAGGEMDFKRTIFDYQSGAGTKTAKFTGTVYPDVMGYMVANNIEAYPEGLWPTKESRDLADVMKDLTQYVDNPTRHISENIYLTSDIQNMLPPAEFLAGNFTMKPDQTLFCIDIKSAPAEVGNIARASLHLDDSVGSSLNISGEMKTGKLYFLVRSVKFRDSYPSINLVLFGKDGEKKASAVSSLNGPNPFKPGHRYYYTATTEGGGGNLIIKLSN